MTKVDHNKLDFLGHLDVLRGKLLISLAVLAAAAIVSFIFIDQVIMFLKAPVRHLTVELIYLRPQEKFITYIKIAFFSGLFAAVPVALVQLATFILPALTKKERRYFFPAVLSVIVFFYGGAAFSYFFLTPTVFNFFIDFAKNDGVKALWSVGEYFNMLIILILMMGLVFQTPWILLVLIKIGVLSVDMLTKYRRHVIVAIFIIAALITPTVDLYTQSIVGVTLYLLYEFTIILARILFREKKR
ncbi:MAG: twin-arginine translocase subunit TatC [Spirochaetota bacterium]